MKITQIWTKNLLRWTHSLSANAQVDHGVPLQCLVDLGSPR